MASDWGQFEDYVWQGWWRREFAPANGWDSQHQKPLLDGRYVVDFAAWDCNVRAVGDAKDKAALTAGDVDKLIEDAGAFRAGRAVLLIASDTHAGDG